MISSSWSRQRSLPRAATAAVSSALVTSFLAMPLEIQATTSSRLPAAATRSMTVSA